MTDTIPPTMPMVYIEEGNLEEGSLKEHFRETKKEIESNPIRMNARIRKLIFVASTSVGLLLGGGSALWYLFGKTEEGRARENAVSGVVKEKEMKALTRDEIKFVQDSKKLTISEEGDIVVDNVFAPRKPILPVEEDTKEDTVSKNTLSTPPQEAASGEESAIKTTPPIATKTSEPLSIPKDPPMPPPNIIREDGQVVITGKPGETKQLAELLKNWSLATTPKKQNK